VKCAIIDQLSIQYILPTIPAKCQNISNTRHTRKIHGYYRLLIFVTRKIYMYTLHANILPNQRVPFAST